MSAMRADHRRLPPDVRGLLHVGHGVFSVGEAASRGITRARLARLARAELLVRLASGVYASAESCGEADEWSAFALRSRAFILSCGPDAVAGGWSAAAILGLPAISDPPELPLALVPAGVSAASNHRFGRVRAVSLPRRHRAVVDGCPVTPMPRTVVDIARTASRADALVIADAALSTPMTDEHLRAVLEFESGWPGAARASWIVDHADAYAESALETLGRLTCIEHDLPVPISNASVEAGPMRYRLDHLLDDRWLALEGDGALKYDNRLDAGRVVAQQHEREWHLREVGLDVARYSWQLARHDRARLAARFRSVIASCPVRAEPFRWWREPHPRQRLLG